MTRFDVSSGAIRFRVRLTPKGGRDALEGWDAHGSSHLKARVRAAPRDGEANDALAALLAKALGVPRSAVAIVAGRKARLKTVAVAGDTASLRTILEKLGEAE